MAGRAMRDTAGPPVRVLMHLALIAAVGLLVYSNTFHAPFQLDDVDLIAKNPVVKDLGSFMPFSGPGLDETASRRYVGYLSFALNYRLNGTDPWGYHLINLFVHVMNALLVYLLVSLMFMTPFLRGSLLAGQARHIALLSGLFFVSHPLQTEAVTYVFQRLASLAAFFCLLSLASYAGSRLSDDPRRRYALLALSLASAVLAMKTKENAFTLPLVITLYEFLFFTRPGPRAAGATDTGTFGGRVLRLAPFLLAMFIIPLSISGTGRPLGEVVESASRGYAGISRWDYLCTQLRVVVTYVRLLFLPVNQNVDYDYPLYGSLLNPPVLLSALFIFSLIGLSIWLIVRSGRTCPGCRVIAFGVFWFFITLSVESGVIPIPMLINEYRVYLPSAGAFMAMTAGAFMLLPVKGGEGRVRTAALLLLMTPAVLLPAAAYVRNETWRSRISLWEDAVAGAPEKLRPHVNLGLAYYDAGRTEEAIGQYLAAFRLRPQSLKVHINLGLAYFDAGRMEKAVRHYRAALRLDPDSVQVLNNLGLAYREMGLYEKAEEYLLKAERARRLRREAGL
jgi:hypothetical protein